MYKIMFVLHERAGMAREKALNHWRTKHAEIVRTIPNVKKYVQSHAKSAADGKAGPFLGIAELVFENEAAFQAAAASSQFADAIKDVGVFSDPANMPTAIVEDVSVV